MNAIFGLTSRTGFHQQLYKGLSTKGCSKTTAAVKIDTQSPSDPYIIPLFGSVLGAAAGVFAGIAESYDSKISRFEMFVLSFINIPVYSIGGAASGYVTCKYPRSALSILAIGSALAYLDYKDEIQKKHCSGAPN